MLLKGGADTNLTDSKGRNCLHLACRYGDIESIHGLFAESADAKKMVSCRDISGNTSVHYAARYGREIVLEILIKGERTKGHVDINEKGQFGMSALHMTACFGHISCTRFLTEHGARVNSTDKEGRTPLHAAAHRGCFESVQHLLESGSDCMTVDEQNRTALHYAASLSVAMPRPHVSPPSVVKCNSLHCFHQAGVYQMCLASCKCASNHIQFWIRLVDWAAS